MGVGAVSDTAVLRFYRFHAYIYDFTRWTILHGRRRAAAKLGLRPDSRVLEIGCGTGLNFRYVLEHLDPQAGKLTGLDFSPHMLRKAEKRVARHGWSNVELLHADATKMNLSDRFDGILFAYSIALIPDWPAALARAYEHLVPGGHLVVLEFSRFDKWGPVGAVARAWLRHNHVETLQPYEDGLRQVFGRIELDYWLGNYTFTAVGRKGA